MGWLVALSMVAALGIGLWLGRPRRFEQPLDEIEQRLEEERDHETVERRTTPISFIQRQLRKGSDRRRGRRDPFRLG